LDILLLCDLAEDQPGGEHGHDKNNNAEIKAADGQLRRPGDDPIRIGGFPVMADPRRNAIIGPEGKPECGDKIGLVLVFW
jgi:hypothetical protein